MAKNKENFSPRWGVIILPVLVFGAVLIMGFINTSLLESTLTSYFNWFMINFGWFVDIAALGFVLFCLGMIFHPIGNLKFGGEDAEPEFKFWNWFAMSLCAGMAIGIVMWPPEVLMHALEPAKGAGLEPKSQGAMLWAMKKTFLHWTLTPYSIYVVCGAIIGYVHYNLEKKFAASSALYPLLGDKAFGKVATVVDSITLFSICGGVAGSLGYGILQLGDALQFSFGVQPGPVVWGAIAAVIITSYTTSSITGLDKGIQWLSDKNAWLFIGLLVFVIFAGPTAFSLNLTTQAAGDFFNNFIQTSTFTSPFQLSGDMWPQWWDMYWFTDWLSFAPIVGLFLARLCYGRTIRQFVLVNLLLPAGFGMLWFGVFGSFFLHLEFIQGAEIAAVLDAKGMEILMLKMFDFLPLSNIIRPIMILTILISFITLADSMTSTASMVSTTGFEKYTTEEPPMKMKIFWGLLMGGVAVVSLMIGGIDGVKMIKTMAGIPILFFEVLMIIGFVRHRMHMGSDNNMNVASESQESTTVNQ